MPQTDTKGYVIKDEADFSLADFQDAIANHGDDVDDYCSEEHDGFLCTRAPQHTGPHAAAAGHDSITALWEDGE